MKEVRRNIHADPPGRLDPPVDMNDEEPEREVHKANDESNARIKACEEELQSRWEAIAALRDVVMKQRATIQSLKAEQHVGAESTFPHGDIREQTASKISKLSGSDSSDESEFSEELEPTGTPNPVMGFEQIRQSQDEFDEDEEVSEITCEEQDTSIDSSNFLKMEYEMQVMLESLKEQAASPVVVSPLDTVVSFETSKTPRQESTASVGNGGIEDVIESIQEQACHVDAAIALDTLQTTKNELQLVTNKLRNRSTEVGELKNQIKVLECQIATIELERDLHVSFHVLNH